MASSNTIALRSSDGETFDLNVVAAMESQVIKGMIEDGCAECAIPLPNVNSKILAKVTEYCKKHVETPKAEEHAVNDELKAWVADLVKVDWNTFVDLVLAANYLNIKSLLDLARQTIVDMTKEMSPDEICKMHILMKEKSLDEICKIYNIKTGLTLRSSDSETFDLDVAVATKSQVIMSAVAMKSQVIEDGCADNAIPLPNVTSNILAKVIEYCKKHAVNDELGAWDADFVKVDLATLFDLIMVRLLNLFFFFVVPIFFFLFFC
ncbi:hypothetical protein PVL29_002835 [Vitis rotundifolia]|uniref:SKP1-like protein n=1 Tax=Vitis rotundifolia TaxID=103349 RepID=A0AA39E251_VITRO|nr:hypothetical protein PVL29_002835 [Vitis rotundifolia]